MDGDQNKSVMMGMKAMLLCLKSVYYNPHPSKSLLICAIKQYATI